MSLLITNAGLKAATAAKNEGIKLNISAIGFGLSGYKPDADQTELRNEFMRKNFDSSAEISLGHLQFTVIIEENEEFNAYEIGYYLEDGTLLDRKSVV